MATDESIRASDAERGATAELLRRHHAEGRLDTDELEERIERCYAAKTRGELDALTADLPGPRRRQQPPTAGRRRRVPHVPAVFLAIAAVIALSATTDAHVLWLIWPLAFFAFGPFRRRHGWRRIPWTAVADPHARPPPALSRLGTRLRRTGCRSRTRSDRPA